MTTVRALSIRDQAELLAVLHVLDAPEMSVSLFPSQYAPEYGCRLDSTIVGLSEFARVAEYR